MDCHATLPWGSCPCNEERIPRFERPVCGDFTLGRRPKSFGTMHTSVTSSGMVGRDLHTHVKPDVNFEYAQTQQSNSFVEDLDANGLRIKPLGTPQPATAGVTAYGTQTVHFSAQIDVRSRFKAVCVWNHRTVMQRFRYIAVTRYFADTFEHAPLAPLCVQAIPAEPHCRTKGLRQGGSGEPICFGIRGSFDYSRSTHSIKNYLPSRAKPVQFHRRHGGFSNRLFVLVCDGDAKLVCVIA